MAPVMAGVLARRGASALIFRGDDGLDELSISGPSTVWAVNGGSVREDRVTPAKLELPPAGIEALRGGDAQHNANITRRFLSGETGPVRDAVLLNAAAALVALDGVTDAPVDDQLGPALVRAAESVDSGMAQTALDRWIEVSRGGE
jgi:anthranilate phosphoribosyltransferase